ncbi:hypothetical protein [Pseudonocardia sp. Ae717_Ps2]|uniref:hypothetical protein n=1 Tax=Pseudonocardia sp. Ae717_Ps2 TaxID=1885573 RepID=UPI001185E365|nr:hypothetical protein [Pseudonocardia sp. Ae717_Ps2]
MSRRSVHSATAVESPAARAARICSRTPPWVAAATARRTSEPYPATVVTAARAVTFGVAFTPATAAAPLAAPDHPQRS